MKRMIISMVMVAVALIFGVELGMESLFLSRGQETAAVMADVRKPVKQTVWTEPPEVYVLFGVDTAEGDEGRSDCILLASLEGDTVRMCSIARDTMVTIPGTGEETKLGHAYAYGGPDLAMAAIRENFGLDIKHYATVNYSQLPEIVDMLGGAEVPLTQEEWDYLGLGRTYLGQKRLTGEEALRYCRIRALDNDDMRTARQRNLVSSMLTAVQRCSKARLPALVMTGLEMCRTNVELPQALRLGWDIFTRRGNLRTESISIPGETVSAWGGIREDGIWYYVYDLGRASEVMREFFYGESAQAVSAAQ